MIKHVVVAKLKEYNEENLKAQMDLMQSMKEHIPSIAEHEVYADFMHVPISYDIIAITTFKTREDMNAYLAHPYHCEYVVSESEKYVAELRLIDFEL